MRARWTTVLIDGIVRLSFTLLVYCMITCLFVSLHVCLFHCLIFCFIAHLPPIWFRPLVCFFSLQKKSGEGYIKSQLTKLIKLIMVKIKTNPKDDKYHYNIMTSGALLKVMMITE